MVHLRLVFSKEIPVKTRTGSRNLLSVVGRHSYSVKDHNICTKFSVLIQNEISHESVSKRAWSARLYVAIQQ